MKRKTTGKSKQPQIGGAAAAAWEHHLTPEAKERLGEEYAAELKRKHDAGKLAVLIISATNLGLALMSLFISFNLVTFAVQVLLSVFLFFGLPGARVLFAIGVVLIIILSGGGWTVYPDYGYFRVVFTAVNTILPAIGAILLFASSNIADYLYTKRYG